jgi:hypothetical protein
MLIHHARQGVKNADLSRLHDLVANDAGPEASLQFADSICQNGIESTKARV